MDKKTPLELATKITINSIEDVIGDYKLTSLLIWCWKNNKNLIEFFECIPDSIIDEIVDEEFLKLSDVRQQDLLLLVLFLNCMKHKDWTKGLHEEESIKDINKILSVFISTESINRESSKAFGSPLKVVEIILKKKNIYDLNSYVFKANPELEIEQNENGF